MALLDGLSDGVGSEPIADWSIFCRLAHQSNLKFK